MKTISQKISLRFDESGNTEIVLTTKAKVQAEVAELKAIVAKGKELSVEVKPYRKQRGLDANAYMWVICQKIAEKLSLPNAPITKEDIYREAIRKVGQFTIVPIKNEAVEQWIYNWQHDGNRERIGWICEIIGDSKFEGYTNIINYFGSSVYDTKSMSILIDYIVSEAKEQGIETMTENEIRSLKSAWGEERAR